jgi:hypothetical protein
MVDEADLSTYADLVKKTASRKLELLAARATLPSRGIIWCYHKVWKSYLRLYLSEFTHRHHCRNVGPFGVVSAKR